MVVKESASRKAFNIFNTILLTAITIIMLYPLLYIVAASFTDDFYLIQGDVRLIPKGFQTAAYKNLLSYGMLWKSYLNTFFYTICGTMISMTLTVMGAYVLSRKHFYGKKFLSIFTIITMWFNAGMIPNYLLVDRIGIYNTPWALLLPMAVVTYNLVVLRSFFEQIPDELIEAARIDGCNHFQVLYKIVLKVSTPALMTVGLFYAVSQWNSFMPALLYLRNKDYWPLQLVLRELVIMGNVSDVSGISVGREGLVYASLVISMVPMLMLYPFVQKFFVKGMMLGAVKG